VRRASFAIMANVAEGVERGGTLEFVRYLSDAKDEIEELRRQLVQAQQEGFIISATLARLEVVLESLGCMISGLMTSINLEFLNTGSVSVDYQAL
jgi:four helix bundle protein